jgi:hypothetical protein
LASGGETGIVLFFEVAQQVLFAQQFGLQPSGLGAFTRMQEAAGSWSGLIAIASTTAIRIGAVLRMTNILSQRTRRVDRTSFASRHFVVNVMIPRFEPKTRSSVKSGCECG